MMPPVKRVAVQADYYTSSSSVKLFFEHCKLSTILNKSGFRKAKGHSVTEILFVLFLLPLIGTTISRITEESQGFLDIKVTTQVPHHEKPKRRLRRGLPFAVEREECKALADRH